MTLTPGFYRDRDRDEKKPRRRLRRKKPVHAQEQRAGKKLQRLGARAQPGSGNQLARKGDFDVPTPESFLAEAKSTVTQTLAVNMGWLRKIDREARGVRKTPMLIMQFEAMSVPVPKDWAAVPLEVLVRLIEAAGWDWEQMARE